MIYVTGDVHGKWDASKLNTKNFPEQHHLTHDDYVIVCGDMGIVWNNDNEDKYWQKWFNDKNFTTLFIDGNHENFNLLATYPVEKWHGGLVHRICPNVLHLMRGQIFEIEGKTFFTMGGATSIDRIYRTLGISWWPEELPSFEECTQAEQVLKQANYQVDYILTHTAPINILYAMKFSKGFDSFNEWLYHEVEKKVTFQHWYFGHFHLDKEIDDKHTVLFKHIQLL